MNLREQLTQEIAQTPDALLEEILDFCLFVKQRKAKPQDTAYHRIIKCGNNTW